MLCTIRLIPLVLLVATQLHAADFFVDPQHGDPANDGSAEKPWQSLQQAFDRGLVETRGWSSLPYRTDSTLVAKNAGAPIKPGDTIWLRSGSYGDLVIRGHYNTDVITIAAAEGHMPRFRSVLCRAANTDRRRPRTTRSCV